MTTINFDNVIEKSVISNAISKGYHMKKQVIQTCKILILLIYREAFFLFLYLDLNDKLQVKSARGQGLN